MANIDVYNNGLMIGRLKKENTKHFYSYTLDANSALSLTMPVRLESYSYDGLHPFFQMNMPEGVLRDAIEKATAKEFGSDDLTVLALLGKQHCSLSNKRLCCRAVLSVCYTQRYELR